MGMEAGRDNIRCIKLDASKANIRCMKLDARKKLTPDEICSKSAAICSKLLALWDFEQAGLVMAYMDFRNEVSTGDFIRESIRRGKRLALPVVANAGGRARELLAYEISSIDGDLKEGAYGIYEPDPGKTKKADTAEIDFIVVPCVAFDTSKFRVGYGAGYYDRFMKKLRPGCTRIGLAFDLQLADKIPAETHDVALDMIITENRIIT